MGGGEAAGGKGLGLTACTVEGMHVCVLLDDGGSCCARKVGLKHDLNMSLFLVRETHCVCVLCQAST